MSKRYLLAIAALTPLISSAEIWTIDSQKDWKEEHDLAAKLPEKTEEMKRALIKAWEQIEAEGPKEWWRGDRSKPMKGATLNY